MSEAAIPLGAADEPRPRPRRSWLPRLTRIVAGALIALLLLVATGIYILDTDAGHRFIVDRIAMVSPRSGLKIRIGRIDGSIWNEVRLRDVRLYDPKGLFAESSMIEADWTPAAWLSNRLWIDRLQSELVTVHRLPKLRPSEKPGPILPGFDIHIGRLVIDQLRFEPAITGQRRIGRLVGDIDIRSGRAIVHLNGAVRGSGERLKLALDSEPDRGKFDADVRLHAPADSIMGALVGIKRPFALVIQGDGSWATWSGSATIDVSDRRTGMLLLQAKQGRYSLRGRLAPAPFLTGKQQRLTTPEIQVEGAASFANRRLDGRISGRTEALKIESKGVVDLAASSFDDVQIGVDLLRPAALFPNMSGSKIRLTMVLDGPFGTTNFAYRLSSPHFAFDTTGFDDVLAEGRGHWSNTPILVPIRFTARHVTGVGEAAGGILANLRVEGVLKFTSKLLSGENLMLTSDKMKAKISLFVDLVTGHYDVIMAGGLTRYLIPGLGIVDVLTELRVVPGPGGKGSVVTGKGRAWVRRFDNKFLAGLAGGLPQIETALLRSPEGVLHFQSLRLIGPAIRLTGNGYRRRDGTFHFEGPGTQGQYGPFTLLLDGPIDRPKMTIGLAHPMNSLGLTRVTLQLDPTAQGYAYRAAGGSTLGTFTSHGAILLPRGQSATIQIAALDVSGTHATGSLRSDPGGFNGQLTLAGGGVNGSLLFRPASGVQRIEAHLSAQGARFAGPPALAVQRGRVDGVILLNPDGTSIEGSVSLRGVSRGALSLARLDAQASLRGGRGQVRGTLAGVRGRNFALELAANVASERISVTGSGTIDRRPVALAEPAVFTSERGGWRLAPTSLRFAGGKATFSGLFGAATTEVAARMDAMPLTVLDIAYPQLGLGGTASGSLSYRTSANGVPVGDINLRVSGLTRAGLVLTTKPVDVGVVAKLDGVNAAMRAVAVSEGRTIGRAQARVAPMARGGTLMDRLSRAPLMAQLRYNGPADTLWRLTGVELLDLSGPLAVGADATGTMENPQVRGIVRAAQARLESPILGTVIENIQSSGRFSGSQLLLDSFSGSTKKGGRISGGGSFNFGVGQGIGMDVVLDAQAAQLIDRDDIKAQVTGPLKITSEGNGGTISGKLALVSGTYRLGAATASAQVPRLPVREINLPYDEVPAAAPAKPWTIDLAVNARNRLQVTGLGMTSEWGADLALKGTVDTPRISGQARLIRGNYDFAGRRFDLERGFIYFQGESPPNPRLDITAEGGIQGIDATIRVTGRGQKPEITFTSTPALPQDELLSRLLFGTSITNLSAPEAVQLAAAVAALNNTGGSLDPINALRRVVGLDRLRILPADIATGQGTSIAAGKYIGRQVYVEVITDGRGYSATRLEYQITRWLSILSTVSTVGRQSVNLRISKDY
jgi:translocation and assembly module TamB